MNNYKSRFSLYLPFIFALVLIIGVYFGSRLNPGPNPHNNLFKIDLGRNNNKLDNVMNYILQEYVDSVDAEELTEEGIAGMLKNLDPHSQYIPASSFHDVTDPLMGNFEGIGIQFRIEKDTALVVHTIPGGPSEKVGLMAGDRIVMINDSLVAGIGLSDRDAIKQLKGKRGSKVKVGVFRRGISDILDFEIIRDVIPTYSIDAYFMPTDEIGYIKLSKFSATTYDEFAEAIIELEAQGMKKLIFDLRGNTGGYLNEAIDLSDEFLAKGQLIVYTEGANQPRESFYATSKGSLENNPLIVLVDEGSASASEIFAGAIQDNDRGTIVGRRSFGKGLVQRQMDFLDGSALRLTIARYFTPTGRCIQKPYNSEEGFEAYHYESYHRYVNGEMESADSVKFNDTLRYVTTGGKVVYGGGGIMPDVFIPIERDSSMVWYNQIVNKGLIFRFAFDYSDNQREELKIYETVDDFKKDFDFEPKVLNEFLVFTKEKGIDFDPDGFNRSKEKILVLLKAYFARNIFEDKEFYPIYMPIDPAFSKSIELFNLETESLK
jgi:carboxyl-terminal processing protease